MDKIEAEPFFSIIIPAYNVMAFGIDRCLEHIWNQPLESELYEIICVDDCSTDNTFEYVHRIAEKHSNIRVLHHSKNMRQGAARNTGIKNARGKYVCFMDADDYYHKSCIKQIYDILVESEIEILNVEGTWQKFEGPENNSIRHIKPYQELCSGEEFLRRNGVTISAQGFFVKKDFLLKNKLFYKENMRHEDCDWCLRAIIAADKIRYAPILTIHHCRHSLQTTAEMSQNTFGDKCIAIKISNEEYQKWNKDIPAISNLLESLFKESIKMCTYVFANPIWKYHTLKENLAEIDVRDKKLQWIKNHFLLFAYLSNLTPIPFYFARKILNYIRWKTVWKPQND